MNSIKASGKGGVGGIGSPSNGAEQQQQQKKKHSQYKRQYSSRTALLSERHSQHINSVDVFLKKFKVKEIVFNSHAGLFESYMCEAKATAGSHEKSAAATAYDKVYLQALRIKQEEIWELSAKIAKLKALDSTRIETFIDCFHSHNHVYVVNKYVDQGRNDLYHLRNLRQSFSTEEVAQIAFQMLGQLASLHHQQMVFKYLTPKSVIVV